jgi:hypothetical protein
VYVLFQEALCRIPLAGGAPEWIATRFSQGRSFVLNGGFAYLEASPASDGGTVLPAVLRVPVSGGPYEVILDHTWGAMTFHGDDIYVARSSGNGCATVSVIRPGGAEPQILMSSAHERARSLAVRDGQLVVELGSGKYAQSDPPRGMLVAIPLR